MKKKVFVGMSGGVDSSVSAALLKEKGYDVTGVFIKVWQPDFVECTWKEDRLDAMRVASILDIPFITLDLEKDYKQEVIDYMIEEYRKGRTPNPDVMCNREVKFGAFYRWVKEQDKNAYIATGHYAKHNGASLLTSADENKDQTYFLWTLSRDILPWIMFPVGDIEKSDVRLLAKKFNLPVATKKDSQGLCFVGTIDIKTLLKQYIEEKNGNVLDEKGEVIGVHTGVMFYTLGERHGFTITKKKTDDSPYFVIAKDFKNNTITVSHNSVRESSGDTVFLSSCNWTMKLEKNKIYDARARYRAPRVKVVCDSDNSFRIIENDCIATPGQSLVIYDGDICIGGGIIDR